MVEKPSTMRSKILASLPKAASPVTFQISSPLSPVKVAGRKGFPSPVISIIPQEARRNPKNSSFDQREPGSPKVSCIGQVRNRKNKKKNKSKHKPVLHPEEDITPPSSAKEMEKKKKKPVSEMESFKGGKEGDRVDVMEDHKARVVERTPSSSHTRKYRSNCSSVLEMFDWRICEGRGEEQVEKVIIPSSARRDAKEMELFKGEKQGDKVDVNDGHKQRVVERVPPLNQMKRYASSRGGVLDKFDWRICEGRGQEQGENVTIPCSARNVVGGEVAVEARKEANVWKRRNKPPPPTHVQI